MNPDQTAPKGVDSIWVNIVCNIGYQNTKADERKDDDCCCGLRAKPIGYPIDSFNNIHKH